ncbi:MAG: hypothetical protein KME15_20565 [Drouetiella hepatica Uher 2000/2452]|jgi:preprotein translocase subunit Sss1|uniref:Uncharacterized protein n=1 Tax=Drouetiella hepatica Uher 2000/2452 TaxID=904376 RepID=A0A951QEG8_9CYAN|nr:hypothetical protein [Drouetiella hepatica Uher 2000/2452]
MLNDAENTVHEITAESHPNTWALLQATTEEIISDDLPSRIMCPCCTHEFDLNANLDATFYDAKDQAIADLHFDVKSLEASTDTRLAALVSQADDTEYSVAALQFNVERLEGTVNTLNDILDNDSTQIIRITTRRFRVAEFLRYMAMTAIGFTAVLTIGAAISGSQAQKDEFAQLAVFTGFGAVLGIAIGYSTSED